MDVTGIGVESVCFVKRIASLTARYIYLPAISAALVSLASGQECLLTSPTTLALKMYPGLTITGTIGITNRIEYLTRVTNTNNWIVLTNLVLPSSPFFYVDTSAPGDQQRFYRAVALPPLPVPVTNMVFIAPGTFTMGSPPSEIDRENDESPLTDVTVSRGFWIGKYEVTRREFGNVMGRIPGVGDFLDLPVNHVSWDDANAYCVTLTQRERAAGRLPSGYTYRLPREAEWEFAVRAGTSTRFFFGDDPSYLSLSNYAWFGFTTGYEYHFGGEKLPNQKGLCDVYGNVSEWCLDWYDLYPGGNRTDWSGPPFGVTRVIRGGPSNANGAGCRSANRSFRSPSDYTSLTGFRIVLSCN